jgi:hypothetical protein
MLGTFELFGVIEIIRLSFLLNFAGLFLDVYDSY